MPSFTADIILFKCWVGESQLPNLLTFLTLTIAELNVKLTTGIAKDEPEQFSAQL